LVSQDGETRDGFEVARIARDDRLAAMERRCADEKIDDPDAAPLI